MEFELTESEKQFLSDDELVAALKRANDNPELRRTRGGK